MTLDEKTVTRLLTEARRGAVDARNALFEAVYNDLHRIASAKMRGEPSDHTLEPGALVNAAYLRLADGLDREWNGRRHFFGAAANAMRRVLIDHARAKRSEKRGGDRHRKRLTHLQVGFRDAHVEIGDLGEAIEVLAQEDPRSADVATLKILFGAELSEIAQATGVSLRTASSDWAYAKAWLRVRFGDE